MYGLIKRISWLIIAIACICIGLQPFGVNVLGMLHLENMDMNFRYLVGIVGAGSLVMFFLERMMGGCCKS